MFPGGAISARLPASPPVCARAVYPSDGGHTRARPASALRSPRIWRDARLAARAFSRGWGLNSMEPGTLDAWPPSWQGRPIAAHAHLALALAVACLLLPASAAAAQLPDVGATAAGAVSTATAAVAEAASPLRATPVGHASAARPRRGRRPGGPLRAPGRRRAGHAGRGGRAPRRRSPTPSRAPRSRPRRPPRSAPRRPRSAGPATARAGRRPSPRRAVTPGRGRGTRQRARPGIPAARPVPRASRSAERPRRASPSPEIWRGACPRQAPGPPRSRGPRARASDDPVGRRLRRPGRMAFAGFLRPVRRRRPAARRAARHFT